MGAGSGVKRGGGTRFGGAQLLTRTKDEKGHYERWPEVRVHPDLDTAARMVLSDPACEYETMTDLIRGAVLNFVGTFQPAEPKTRSILSILKAIEEENNASEMRRRFTQHINKTATEAYELVGEGRISEAAKHVHRVLMHVREMDREDPWRAEFEGAIKSKFGHLFRMTKVASFVPDWDQLGGDEWLEDARDEKLM